MNKTKLKSYAPQARQDFIAAVTVRANLLGLSEKSGQQPRHQVTSNLPHLTIKTQPPIRSSAQ